MRHPRAPRSGANTHTHEDDVMSASLQQPGQLSARDSFGDRVIVRIVDVRRLLRGESDRPQPSQWRLGDCDGLRNRRGLTVGRQIRSVVDPQ
jgi:hypothetical protein